MKDASLEFLDHIDKSSKRLLVLIEDGLTASRIESGQRYISPLDCDVTDLVKGVKDSFDLLTKEK